MALSLRLGLGLASILYASTSTAALSLSFVSGPIDPRITFTRASTATFFNSAGVMQTASANVARLDHNPSTLAPLGLLIEEARTNLVLRSQELGNVAWQPSGVTITTDSAVAPDGTTTAELLAIAVGGRVQQDVALASATVATDSVWVKSAPSGSATHIRLTTNNTLAWDTGASIKVALTSEWQRISLLGTTTGSATHRLIIGAATVLGTNDADCIGNVLVWGAQLEAGAFATSYIPTVAATVTRAADSASMTGTNFSSWFTAAQGTFVFEGDSPGSGTRTAIAADDNTANEAIRLYTSALDPKFIVTDGAITQADIDAGTITANAPFKLAAAYTLNDFAASAGGAVAVTDALGTLPTVTLLRIGADQAGNILNGHIKSLTYHATRKTNAELVTLST